MSITQEELKRIKQLRKLIAQLEAEKEQAGDSWTPEQEQILTERKGELEGLEKQKEDSQ